MAGKKSQAVMEKPRGSDDQPAQRELWQELNLVKENLARLPELERNMAIIMAKLEELADTVHSAPTRQWDRGKQKIDDEPGQSSFHGEASQVRGSSEGWKAEQLSRRMEMPIFAGGDPDDWIFRVERFFAFQSLSEQKKLHWVAVHLEDEALAWFQWEERRRPFRSWEDLRFLLLDRFRSSLEGTLSEKFLQLKQTGSVREYRQKFERAASHLSDLPEHLLEAQFVTRLQPEVRAELLVLRPAGLNRMTLTAQRVEDKFAILHGRTELEDRLAILQPTGPGPGEIGIGPEEREIGPPKPIMKAQNTTSFSSTHGFPISPAQKVVPPAASSPSHLASSFRRLSDSELLAKREKGLCYRCNERFFPGHRCKSKELMVLVCQETEEKHEELQNKEGSTSEEVTQFGVA